MDNIHRIDEFLKLMAAAARDGRYIDVDSVYANLIYLGVDNKRKDISSNFDKWISHFAMIRNINVFVDPGWSYFCQFINSFHGRVAAVKAIKLYIPVDSEHIEKGAIDIFEFLTRENISHVSKIGRHVRFDDIVIRVDSIVAADKIIGFINNNQYIKEGLIQPNPFTVNDNGVSIAWDGNLSYNMVVSNWISDYINWELENNNLYRVGYSRFYAFIQERSYTLFEEGEGLQKYAENLLHQGVIRNDGFYGSIDIGLANFYDVTRLLLMSLDPKMNKKKLFNFIRDVSNEKHQRKNIDRLHYLCTNENVQEDRFFLQQKGVLRLSYEYMCEKYGVEQTRELFILFMNTGNYSYITNYKGARNQLISNGITNDVMRVIVSYWRCEAIDNAILATYNKYNLHQAYAALNDLVYYRNFSKFTNDNNSRMELIYRCSDGDILESMRQVMRDYGYEFERDDQMCSLYLDRVINKIRKSGRRM